VADDRPLRQARRQPTEPLSEESWDRFGDFTPSPADPAAANEWARVRDRLDRLDRLELGVAGIVPAIDALKRHVDELKIKDSERSKSIGELTTSSALHTQSLSTIERGISELKASISKDSAEIKAQRSDDGTRFRFVLQITTSLLAALAAIAVTVIGIATR
jgi:hypothetical protein